MIREYFACPGEKGLYILGCYARHVTLYSQQVRAFNLIHGLAETRELKPDHRVAVIGAGAAGLTAAAAARYMGCKVTLLEEMEGPLELQRNNRQRWIHPRIYDWPAPDSELRRAGLPILNWSAGYAERVALDIQERWEASLRLRYIDAIYSVEDLQIRKEPGAHKTYTLTFSGEPGGLRVLYVDVLIVAIGFGLEPRTDYGDSYWAEDDYDVGFRRGRERWLVSGLGDGALTDLMRLCIKRFRHDQIMSLIGTSAAMARLFEDLRKLNADTSLSDAELSGKFESRIKGQGLEQLLKDQTRKHGPEVVLTARTGAIYGRRSSILNRVIVALLSELGAFRFKFGPISKIVRKGRKTLVYFGETTKSEKFDRVILRHGPEKAVDAVLGKWFPENKAQLLNDKWNSLSIYDDKSRKQQWKVGAFGPEREADSASSATNTQKYAEEMARFGVAIRSLTIHKELRDEGSARLTYVFEGVTAVGKDQSISGIHFYYPSAAGKFEPPVFGDTADRIGLEWEPDFVPGKGDDKTENVLRMTRALAGTVKFEQSLTKGGNVPDFSLQTVILNSDAMTRWEFERMYHGDQALHVDREPLTPPQEYFAALVWCPIEELTLRITLPPACELGTPTVSMFRLEGRGLIEPHEVVTDSVLQLHPNSESRLRPEVANWRKETSSDALSSIRFTAPSAQTWEVSVLRPPVGTCYSLDWSIPDGQSTPEFEKVAESSTRLRKLFVEFREYQESRRDGNSAATRIGNLVQELHKKLSRRQRELGAEEEFELEIMTFNDSSNRLEYVAGTSCDGNLRAPAVDLWLPFGLGIAGVCYKEGNRAFVHFGDREAKGVGYPSYYLPLSTHISLIAFPIDNPGWNSDLEISGKFERSRQCFAVVDVAVRTDSRWFDAIGQSEQAELDTMRGICEEFGDQIAEALVDFGATSS